MVPQKPKNGFRVNCALATEWWVQPMGRGVQRAGSEGRA